MGTDKKRDLSSFALDAIRWVIIAASVLFALWLLKSCVSDISEKEERRATEAYDEAYEDGYMAGWYEGQEALMEYVRRMIRDDAREETDWALEIFNGDVTRQEFVDEYDGLIGRLLDLPFMEK